MPCPVRFLGAVVEGAPRPRARREVLPPRRVCLPGPPREHLAIAHVLPVLLHPPFGPLVHAAQRSVARRTEQPHVHVVVVRLRIGRLAHDPTRLRQDSGTCAFALALRDQQRRKRLVDEDPLNLGAGSRQHRTHQGPVSPGIESRLGNGFPDRAARSSGRPSRRTPVACKVQHRG